ncbi:MAG: flagellar basal body L-ring protein FlgH [Deltaproteobacteria bacterium]|nr:flagellar basal body L-ring protein FlgH [Deltaproteobacteria bacterium]
MNARLTLLLAGLTLCNACAASHINEYQPKRRKYELAAEQKDAERPLSDGSLWQPGRPASMLFTDARALRTNDLVVIKIEEVADARRRADTNLAHESTAEAKIDAFLGLLKKMEGIDPDFEAKLAGSNKTSFKGQGQTARSEFFQATVPATVRTVLPNGNLFVEGHRVILVNSEEQHFYISGVVRPIDIDQENSVKSSMVADAEIEFVGKGVLTDNQRQGWLSRYLGWIWPF